MIGIPQKTTDEIMYKMEMVKEYDQIMKEIAKDLADKIFNENYNPNQLELQLLKEGTSK